MNHLGIRFSSEGPAKTGAGNYQSVHQLAAMWNSLQVLSSPGVSIKKVKWTGDFLNSQTGIPWVPVVQAGLPDLGILSGREAQGVRESLSPPVKIKTRQ